MKLLILILTALLATPAASLIGCAVIEAFLMKTYPQLSWLLPAVVALSSELSRRGFNLDGLLWSSSASYGRYAFYGIAAGAVIGAVLRWFSAPKEVNPI